jgi:hypothetical protein
MQHVVDIQAELDSFLTELIWPGPLGMNYEWEQVFQIFLKI